MSPPTSPTLLERLGLSDQTCTALELWQAPDAHAPALGFAKAPDLRPPDEVAAQIREKPRFAPVAPQSPNHGFELAMWAEDICTFVVQPGAAEVFATETLHELNPELLFVQVPWDQQVGLLVDFPDRRTLFELSPGRVRTYEVETAPAPVPHGSVLVTIEPPDLAALLGPEDLHPDILALAERLQNTGQPFEVLAAVGLVSGLWRAAPRADVFAVLAVEQWPEQRAEAWRDRLSTDVLEAAMAAAFEESDRLQESLPDLFDAALHPNRRRLAAEWLRDRHLLAEVRRVLGPFGAPLDPSLRALDRDLLAAAELFVELTSNLDDPVLLAASARHPSAPWIRAAF